jgi:GntR family transcriptional regulator/MocR family aminotransferase
MALKDIGMNGGTEVQKIDLAVDRSTSQSLTDQIYIGLRAAILQKQITPNSRLPSWRDLAAQLGVSRGTVKAVYDRLTDDLLIVAAGASGTRVVDDPQQVAPPPAITIARPLQGIVRGYNLVPLPFQMGIPAHDAFPAKLWARLRTRALREDAHLPASNVDPRGNIELRTQIASYLGVARGISCVPDQIILTTGYRGGLDLAIRTLGVEGRKVWMEDPGFPITRMGLVLARMTPVSVPVDDEGIDVSIGIERAGDAAMAVVTPGQQAPTGVVLSKARRRQLLDWAAESGAWVIEDDYLSELQLRGRAATALASQDPHGRTIHIGSFGKTLSPTIGLGFVVAPASIAARFGEVAACLAPAPNTTTQLALTGFLADGHYLRHLRNMKRLYTARRDALAKRLGNDAGIEVMAGLAMMLKLDAETDDVALARRAFEHDIAPMPLSVWYQDPAHRVPGLLVSVTNLQDRSLEKACASLQTLIRSSGRS